eukprot:30794_1
MYCLLLLFGIVYSRPLFPKASQCTVIPSGSNFTDQNGDNIVLVDPVVCSKCMTDTNEEGIMNAVQANCSSTGGVFIYYDKQDDCDGTNYHTETVTLNGTCGTMGCAGFDYYEYHTADCSGKAFQNHTNEYIFWSPGQCMGNATQSCVNGQPQTNFYNNPACSGDPVGQMTAGQCVRHGNGKNSYQITMTDNPCGSNITATI